MQATQQNPSTSVVVTVLQVHSRTTREHMMCIMQHLCVVFIIVLSFRSTQTAAVTSAGDARLCLRVRIARLGSIDVINNDTSSLVEISNIT